DHQHEAEREEERDERQLDIFHYVTGLACGSDRFEECQVQWLLRLRRIKECARTSFAYRLPA
ncbi:MAG: hypothetical protein J0J14_14985, partial [Hyphomicrobium sp.]|nr:hypothetical protein [Hyphomicrobium sp.]